MAKKTQFNTEELQGIMSLITDATISITDVVEAMNKRITHPPFIPSTPIQHLISGVFNIIHSSVRLTTKLIGSGLDTTVGYLKPQLNIGLSYEKKEKIHSILNGVMGDYLVDNNNALAMSMGFRCNGEHLDLNPNSISQAYPSVTGDILLMVHGLCMNDLQWNREDHNHGSQLSDELHYTPIFLNYNSGLHISSNGQNFSTQLEELLNAWPVEVESLNIIAHSMGGLVSRSAIQYGLIENMKWTKLLKKIIFLGTPHHGAPLERIGNFIDHLFDALHYTKPFARLVKIRSAGITDLRYGNISEVDWKDQDRFKTPTQERLHIPLPSHVASYAMAASIGKEKVTSKEDLKTRIVGDGLVLIDSALGQHKDPNKSLKFNTKNTSVVYETSHQGLLSSKAVYNHVKSWLQQ